MKNLEQELGELKNKALKIPPPLEEGGRSFDTYRQFHSVISQTKVKLQNEESLPLYQGLNLAAEILLSLKETGKKAILIGNGGSAAIASHEALDLWNHAKIRALAFNDLAQLTCMANDFGFENVFAKPLEMFADPGDLLIAISSSGASKNILNTIEVARRNHCRWIGFSGFREDNALFSSGCLQFYVPSSSYGIVEAAHFLLLHSIIDEVSKC